MTTPLRILLVEDQNSARAMLEGFLRRREHTVFSAEDGKRAIELLQQEGVDLVLTDLRLPGADGMAVLAKTREVQPDALVVIMTAYGTVEGAVQAMRGGAHDYLTKPIDLEELALLLDRVAAHRGLVSENVYLRACPPADAVEGRWDSPAGQRARERLLKAAPTDVTVLITGESGTGKEVAARLIHRHSKRAEGRFVSVHCAAIPEGLLESELFGHERGAFTGAVKTHVGRFELADRGTIFLDEIGELAPSVQVKLLRVLQERAIERVGSSITRRVDVRVVSATNRDLETDVAAGRFREDLFWRLAVLKVEIPPLRERKEELPVLAEDLLRRAAKEIGVPYKPLSPEALSALSDYAWPGNIRELSNRLQAAMILAPGELIQPGDLALPSRTSAAKRDVLVEASDLLPLEEYERRYIERVVQLCEGNQSKAAEVLGIHRNTLRQKVKHDGGMEG